MKDTFGSRTLITIQGDSDDLERLKMFLDNCEKTAKEDNNERHTAVAANGIPYDQIYAELGHKYIWAEWSGQWSSLFTPPARKLYRCFDDIPYIPSEYSCISRHGWWHNNWLMGGSFVIISPGYSYARFPYGSISSPIWTEMLEYLGVDTNNITWSYRTWNDNAKIPDMRASDTDMLKYGDARIFSKRCTPEVFNLIERYWHEECKKHPGKLVEYAPYSLSFYATTEYGETKYCFSADIFYDEFLEYMKKLGIGETQLNELLASNNVTMKKYIIECDDFFDF